MEFKLTKTYLSKRPSKSSGLLIASISLAFLLILFGVDRTNWIANGDLVFAKGEYWRAWTSALLHGDLNHLAHNAFFFTGLAMLLNHYFGFWVFPFLSLFAGGIINLMVLKFYPPEVTLVGVSGIVYFMAAFWLTLYMLIEKRQPIIVRMVHAMAVSLIFLFPETFDPQTSYLAHGFGFLLGFPLALAYYFMKKKTFQAAEVWVPVEKEYDEMENIILLDESSYRQVESEEVAPSRHASDCAQCQLH